jgi:hypothetical protein
MSYTDTSAYTNILGKKDYKRKVMGRINNDGRTAAVLIDLDNDDMVVTRLP